MWFVDLERSTLEDCQPYVQTWYTSWFAVSRYTSELITVGLFVAGIVRREIYLTIFGIVLVANDIVNFLLQHSIQQAVPVPGCGGPYGMPSYQVQHTSAFVVFLLTYPLIWPPHPVPRPRPNVLAALALLAWLAFVTCSHTYLNYNTPAQCLVAAAVGSIVGVAGQLANWRWAWPQYPRMLEWRVFQWREYTDTFCSYALSDFQQK